MTDPSSILPLTATTASLNPFDTNNTRESVETERKQRSLIRTKFPDGVYGMGGVGMMKNYLCGSGPVH